MIKNRFVPLWPSLTAFAEDIGASYETAKGIAHRERHGLGTIPDYYWARAIRGAKRRKIKGVSLATLAAAAEQIYFQRRSADDQRAA